MMYNLFLLLVADGFGWLFWPFVIVLIWAVIYTWKVKAKA